MTDSNLQRLNMVESQVRPSDVTDRRIIKAMLEVPREKFVPASLASMAYMDEPLPVTAANGAGPRYLLAPRTFAKLVQLAEIEPEARGARCRLRHRLFDGRAGQAGKARRRGGIRPGPGRARAAPAAGSWAPAMPSWSQGRLAAGAPAEAPFDVILLNGAVRDGAPGACSSS